MVNVKLQYDTVLTSVEHFMKDVLEFQTLLYCETKERLWDIERKTNYIAGFSRGWPCGIFVVYYEGSHVKLIDGFERINAIKEYLSDQLFLDGAIFSHLDSFKKRGFLAKDLRVICMFDSGIKHRDGIKKELNRYYQSINMFRKNDCFDVFGNFLPFV